LEDRLVPVVGISGGLDELGLGDVENMRQDEGI
jgi:hypothetical protein